MFARFYVEAKSTRLMVFGSFDVFLYFIWGRRVGIVFITFSLTLDNR